MTLPRGGERSRRPAWGGLAALLLLAVPAAAGEPGAPAPAAPAAGTAASSAAVPRASILGSVLLSPHPKVAAFWSRDGGIPAGSYRLAPVRNLAEKPRSDLDAEVKWKDLPALLLESLEGGNAVLSERGISLSRSKGEGTVTAAILSVDHPRRAASWSGWVGQMSGEGALEIELLVSDPSGAPVAALRHRIVLPATGSVRERVREAFRTEVAPALADAVRR